MRRNESMLARRASSPLVKPTSTLEDMTLGERMRIAREKRGMTQRELAREVGVSSQAISLIENGTSKGLRPENLIAVCDALRIRPRWLAIGKGPMQDDYEELSPDALVIAHNWAALSPEQRAAVDALVQTFLDTHHAGPRRSASKRGH